MDRERLTILADFLETVPEDRFDMCIWWHADMFLSCKTAGCAMGWATRIPEFKNDGLIICGNEYAYVPQYSNKSGMRAAQHFFDISHNVAMELFYGGSYSIKSSEVITPIMVSARIRNLLEGIHLPQ